MQDKKAAVFILLGQSNAVGHGIPMKEEDKIYKPLKNVFGLSRKDNQSFANSELIWSGYTSFDMNLAEEQDNTYSVVNCLATLWQNHIDSGNVSGLPDLYIIQIAIGAQGVTDGYMWHPDREKKLVPGKLGTVDISLFPFCEHIFSLLHDSFSKMNIDYDIIGLHWRGGENDVTATNEYLTQNLEKIYTRIFGEFNRLLGEPPIVLHRIVCPDRMNDMDPTGRQLENMKYINEVFENLQKSYKNISVFDPRTAPQYIPDVRGNGLFIEDAVHFIPEVNMWIAENVLKKYCDI
jgi:hypothetical protein